uniref:Uncharacterized protein n=1 Tax=Panagrolaimus sp. PS1159 TaxID=55785 RepID=A0AC35FRS7_9BILA
MSSYSTSNAETTVNKTPPKREREHHGGAGDSIGRNYHDQTPTSRSCTTPRRNIPRRPKGTPGYSTPQAPSRRQLGGNGMRGYSSSYMPMPYSQSTSDDLFAFDDIDVLLNSFKELYDLVEAERFVCDPALMAPFHDSSPESNKMVRPRVNSRANRKDFNDFDISTLKLDEPAPEVV